MTARKPFDVTIAFCTNTAPMHRPPVWKHCERVERVFASNPMQARRVAESRTGARVIDCVCLWDR